MTKRTKTWKIGEECAGGIITAKATENSAKIEIKEWATGQVIASNAFGRVHIGETIENWLAEFTTPYHAGVVREWIGKIWSKNPKLSEEVVTISLGKSFRKIDFGNDYTSITGWGDK